MTLDIALLLGILAFTLASFVREWVPVDVTALTTLGLLLLCRLVSVEEAVAGFSNPAVVTILMMFILSNGLVQSGLVRRIGHRIVRLAKRSSRRASLILLGLTGVISAFINNTAAVSIFIPVATSVANQYRIRPSKLLMPLSYAAIFGGTCTLIGTSTNLLVSALAADHGLPAFSMFEFLRLGGLLFATGMVYNQLIVTRVVPDREGGASLTRKYGMGAYLTEVKIPDGSNLVGRTVLAEQISDRYRINVIEILRGKRKIATDIRHVPLKPGDTLIVRGAVEDIMAFKEQRQLLLLSDTKLDDADLADENNILAEFQLSPTSRLVGQSLNEIDFRKRYGCFVLALNRTGEVIRDKLALIPLKAWDTLLVFGPRQRIEGLQGLEDFIPLQELSMRLALTRRWWISASVIPLVVALAATGILSILESAILGVVVLLVTGALRIQQAYQSIDWTVIFLLVGILPLGIAIEKTGLAAMLARGIVGVGEPLGAVATLALIILVTSILTELITNNSAAVLMVPISFAVAGQLGVDPKPLLMGVAFAASMSFATPTGYQTNTMVFVPGGYRFNDFLKAGLPLNLLFWLMASLLIPVIWPL
ncbi:MAG TPA: sodium:proton antiporter [Thermoanaerobaculia bacterium]|nr:sodium:proton antiporter [Thermoanaerobaculia bacterium]